MSSKFRMDPKAISLLLLQAYGIINRDHVVLISKRFSDRLTDERSSELLHLAGTDQDEYFSKLKDYRILDHEEYTFFLDKVNDYRKSVDAGTFRGDPEALREYLALTRKEIPGLEHLEDRKRHVLVTFVQGAFELIGLMVFLIGFFADYGALIVLGGSMVVLDDVIDVSMGVLNPIFPIILAIVLAILITPWYVGVFWASSAFKVLGIPLALQKVFTPKRITERVRRITNQRD